ncbi:hypothetical protein SAMN02745193_01790 [Erythrobacter sanguineus]|uniref:Uncharacterized protein n=1 Tax=Erythrobacter sanguineus TaxID=198312 RepID=A0A1M7SIK2_9SPHN|nr:hypothetical protein SAMN02745193_01790 [Erythrobacter sanguineus]
MVEGRVRLLASRRKQRASGGVCPSSRTLQFRNNEGEASGLALLPLSLVLPKCRSGNAFDLGLGRIGDFARENA